MFVQTLFDIASQHRKMMTFDKYYSFFPRPSLERLASHRAIINRTSFGR